MEIEDKKIPLIRQNISFVERGIAELYNFVRDIKCEDLGFTQGKYPGPGAGFKQFIQFVEGLEFVKRIEFATQIIQSGISNIDDEIELLEKKLKKDSE